jgi:hypothetical protein
MKWLAIVDVAEGAPISEIRAGLAEELRGSWSLFLAGILREAYATETPTRVVFMLEAASEAEASGHLDALPLVKAGHLTYQIIALRPFANWSLLFEKATPT